jgi:glycolate oxidase subunit GlcD
VNARKWFTPVVGETGVLTESGDLAVYAADHRERGQPPLAVVLPTRTEQVQEIVRVCANHGVAMVPRGAGTGTVGGAVPISPAVVIDLSRLNRLRALDRDNLLADVEAGMVTADFQRAVEEHGLFYPPDPASRETCTLGGNAATNAGGLRAVKYGVTSDWVAGLEVVLADGALIHTGVRTRKGVVGYDLTHLFIGSEGTLGLITALTLRLRPKPATKQTLLGLFADMQQAGRAVLAIANSGVIPAAMELMDAVALEVVRARVGDVAPAGHALLLIDVDGDAESVRREAEAIERLWREQHAVEIRRANDEPSTQALWEARRAISQALYDLRPQKAADDVTVPLTALVPLFEGVERIAAEHRLLHACFGHAGDGNVHVNLLYDPRDADEVGRAKQAREAIFRLTLALGGTLSGEHGVGLSKRPYVAWEQSPALIAVQQRIKRALDPRNLFNPGKALP